jgi:FMN-dependent NADH-azoreductase
MIIVTSRGGDYSPNTYIHNLDFVEPYLRAIFNFVGITDLHFINAQPMDVTASLRRDALLKAIDEAKAMVASNHWDEHEPLESIEFPEGVKPAPLEANM